ncbi:diguanylate cyclase domain-containing protein [Paractinoplanes durhamensis]|uniref:diguanylate cyclase domain-containing protein n=1 Tax=Paractinoplanes durhamensis TaxID=113563 RepID=UPI003627D678
MTRIRQDVLAAWCTVGLGVVAGYQFVPIGTPAAAYVYDALALAVVIALVVRAVQGGGSRLGWSLIAAAAASRLLGDVTYEIYRQVLHRSPWQSPADVFYLLAYPLLVAGALRLAHRRLRLDRAGYLDAAVIAGGLGLVWWLFVIEPMTDPTLLAIAYPTFDIVLIALVARLLIGAGVRRTAVTAVVGGVLCLVGSDIVTFVLPGLGLPEGLVAIGWMLANVLFGAAAILPRVDVPGEDDVTGSPRYGRITILVSCMLLIPTMIFVQDARVGHADGWAEIGCAAAVLVLLVAARMTGFVVRLRRQAGQMEQLALRDDLTGLANRRQFEQRLAEAVADGEPQVALLDLTGFKAVNDRFGHAVGDQLLAAVAGRFTAALRGTDLVARMGGDEFAVLIPDASAETGDSVAARLVAALRAPIPAGGQELLISGCIGIASAPGATDPGELLRRADVAMYAAKAAGRPGCASPRTWTTGPGRRRDWAPTSGWPSTASSSGWSTSRSSRCRPATSSGSRR